MCVIFRFSLWCNRTDSVSGAGTKVQSLAQHNGLNHWYSGLRIQVQVTAAAQGAQHSGSGFEAWVAAAARVAQHSGSGFEAWVAAAARVAQHSGLRIKVWVASVVWI